MLHKMIGRNMKNVLVVSFGFVCLFTAFGGLQSLQSSLNAEQGLGVASLSVIYGSLLLSAILLPPLLIKTLGCKWTIVASMACYLTYSCGNLYSGWESLIPTSAVLGLAGGPLWSAKCTYLTLSAQRQAQGKEAAGEGRREDTDAEGHREDTGGRSKEATDRASCRDGHVTRETTDTEGRKESTTDGRNNIRESREDRNGSNNATDGEANRETMDREGRWEFRGRGNNSKDSRETGDGTNDISRDRGNSGIDEEGSREATVRASNGRDGCSNRRENRQNGDGGNNATAREDSMEDNDGARNNREEVNSSKDGTEGNGASNNNNNNRDGAGRDSIHAEGIREVRGGAGDSSSGDGEGYGERECKDGCQAKHKIRQHKQERGESNLSRRAQERKGREGAREEGRRGNPSQQTHERDGREGTNRSGLSQCAQEEDRVGHLSGAREEDRVGHLSGAREEDRVGKLSQQAQDLLSQYFGIFFAMFQSSAIWGNLLSSLILSQDTHIADTPEEALQYCGVGLCADEFIQSGNTTRPEQKLVYTLMGCYIEAGHQQNMRKQAQVEESRSHIGMGLVAMASVAIFLDNIDGDLAKEFRGSGQSLCSTAMATVRLVGDRKLQLLIPMTIYSGLEQSFLWAEFTKNYVTCALGIHFIGFSMICFGACNSVSSFLCGKIAPLTGRMALLGLAALTNFCCIMGLLFWRPHPDHFVVFFLVAGLWGMADGMLQTQINATYGVLFPDHKEAAFANIRLWESAGFLLAFGYSSHLCLSTKTYVLLASLGLSLLTYPLLELLVRRGRVGCCSRPQQPGEQSAEYGAGDAVHMTSSL